MNDAPLDPRVQRVASAARRSTSLAEAARLAGETPSATRTILERADLWRTLGSPPPGMMMANSAGDLAWRRDFLREHGLPMSRPPTRASAAAHDLLVTDYGAEEVERWLARYDADHEALLDIRASLRAALARHHAVTPAGAVTRSCEHCGEPFESARSDARYCSTACRVAAHRSRAA